MTRGAAATNEANGARWYAFSVIAHVIVLLALGLYFRSPYTAEIIAADEGDGGEGGAIEVGVVSASQLSFSQPKPVSFIGEESAATNNVEVETAKPVPIPDAEVLPTTTKSPKPKDNIEKIERPTANQNDLLVTKQPMRASSPNTTVEVGRSTGSPIPSGAPNFASGIGVSTAPGGLGGATGVPGGSEYGRRIQMILSRNYNPPGGYESAGQQFVVIQLKIARDGRIMSLSGGRVGAQFIKRRSQIDQVNFAAERAIIASNPLPPFPNGFLMTAQEAVAEIWFRYPK
jgi:TonB C terminal